MYLNVDILDFIMHIKKIRFQLFADQKRLKFEFVFLPKLSIVLEEANRKLLTQAIYIIPGL